MLLNEAEPGVKLLGVNMAIIYYYIPAYCTFTYIIKVILFLYLGTKNVIKRSKNKIVTFAIKNSHERNTY